MISNAGGILGTKSPSLTRTFGLNETPEATGNKLTQQFSKQHYINELSKFVPSLVIHKLITDENNKVTNFSQAVSASPQLPELQSMETVVMFADISGFTNLSEMCAKNGT